MYGKRGKVPLLGRDDITGYRKAYPAADPAQAAQDFADMLVQVPDLSETVGEKYIVLEEGVIAHCTQHEAFRIYDLMGASAGGSFVPADQAPQVGLSMQGGKMTKLDFIRNAASVVSPGITDRFSMAALFGYRENRPPQLSDHPDLQMAA